MDAIRSPRPAGLRRPALAAALAAALGVGALSAAGCDPVAGIGVGDFTATVAGDVDSTFAGDAYWTVVDRGGRLTFVLFFFDDDLRSNSRRDYAFVSLARAGDAPGVGVFAVGNAEPNPPAFRGQYADVTDADQPEARGPVLGATDGVLSVTRFDGGLMTGSFRFDAVGLRLPDTATFIAASVNGTFEARYIAPGVLTGLGIPFGLD